MFNRIIHTISEVQFGRLNWKIKNFENTAFGADSKSLWEACINLENSTLSLWSEGHLHTDTAQHSLNNLEHITWLKVLCSCFIMSWYIGKKKKKLIFLRFFKKSPPVM